MTHSRTRKGREGRRGHGRAPVFRPGRRLGLGLRTWTKTRMRTRGEPGRAIQARPRSAPPGPPATLPADSSPVQGPQPTEATRGSSVSEAGISTQQLLPPAKASCASRLAPAPRARGEGHRLGPELPGPVPRRPWSQAKKRADHLPLTPKPFFLTQKRLVSPATFTGPAEPLASAPSPPGPQTGPLPCRSPRLELSPLALHPWEGELPPRAALPPNARALLDPGPPDLAHWNGLQARPSHHHGRGAAREVGLGGAGQPLGC